jgi:hypothetical protein
LPTSYADLEPDDAQDQKEGCGLLWILSAQKARTEASCSSRSAQVIASSRLFGFRLRRATPGFHLRVLAIARIGQFVLKLLLLADRHPGPVALGWIW